MEAVPYAVAVPVAPVDVEDFRSFAADVLGPYHLDHDLSRRRLGLTRERWWVQQTSSGGTLILLTEGSDPEEAPTRLAESEDPYDQWFRSQAGAILGVDLDKPIELYAEAVYTSVRYYMNGPDAIALAAPVRAGKTEAFRDFAFEAQADARDDVIDLHNRVGMHENWWLEQTTEGDVAILYLEGDNLAAAMKELAQSEEPGDVWYREQMHELLGVDVGSSALLESSELLLDWKAAWARTRRGT